MSTTDARHRFASDVQVRGGNILSLLAAMGPFRSIGEEILEANGLTRVTADGWYPLQSFVDALEMISERVGPYTLFQVGKEIPDHVSMPSGIDSFEKVCGAFRIAFELNHRGAPGERIDHRMVGSRSAVIVTRTPYPCDFDRGVIQGFFQKLLGSRVSVTHDPAAPCKATGGESCTYLVRL